MQCELPNFAGNSLQMHPAFNNRGYGLMFLSVLTNSGVYIISKFLLNEISLPVFGFYWFGFGLLWNLANVVYLYRTARLIPLRREMIPWLMLIGGIEVGATLSFFSAIAHAGNPAVIAFLNNVSPVFVILLASLIVKERISKHEGLGVAVTLTGAFLISVEGIRTPGVFFAGGSGYILLSSFLYAFSTVIMKRQVRGLDPALVTLNRSALMLLVSVTGLLVTHTSVVVPGRLVALLLPGSIIGPFLTVYLVYSALRYLDASKVSVISTGRSLVVLGLTWIFFGKLPALIQISGGLLIVAGVWYLTTREQKVVDA